MTEREIAEKMIEDGKALIEEAESKLAALDKPKLKHGDCWLSGGYVKVFLKEYISPCRDCVVDEKHLYTNIGSNYDGEPIVGNIKDYFDDLKRNSKDLDKFMVGHTEWPFKACIFNANDFHILCSGAHFDLKEIIEIHQKLGQMIATAERSLKTK